MSAHEEPRESSPADPAPAAPGDRRNTRVIDPRLLAGFVPPPARTAIATVIVAPETPSPPSARESGSVAPTDVIVELHDAPQPSSAPAEARRRSRVVPWVLALVALGVAAFWLARREPPRPVPAATTAAATSTATALASATTTAPRPPESAPAPESTATAASTAAAETTTVPQIPRSAVPAVQHPSKGPGNDPGPAASPGKPATTSTLVFPND